MGLAKHPIVDAVLSNLTKDQLEAWEERAAILEFDGGYSRELAEALAFILISQEDARKPDQLI